MLRMYLNVLRFLQATPRLEDELGKERTRNEADS